MIYPRHCAAWPMPWTQKNAPLAPYGKHPAALRESAKWQTFGKLTARRERRRAFTGRCSANASSQAWPRIFPGLRRAGACLS